MLKWDRAYENEAVYLLLQSLPPEYIFDGSEHTVEENLLLRAEDDTKMFERYMQMFTPVDALVRGLYLSVYSIIPFLPERRATMVFTRNSFMLRWCLKSVPLAEIFLKAIQAITWGMKREIPKGAKRYYTNWSPEIAKGGDLPVGFSLPDQNVVQELLSDDGNTDVTGLGDQLAALIAKWSAMSVT